MSAFQHLWKMTPLPLVQFVIFLHLLKTTSPQKKIQLKKKTIHDHRINLSSITADLDVFRLLDV